MDWDRYMDEHLQRKVVSQIVMSYGFNKSSATVLPMIFTSVNQRWHELLHRVNAFSWNSKIVTFHDKSLVNTLPRGDLVYLTPDTENVCTKLDPSKYYIIGCLLDHNQHKGVTKAFAEKHNIRMERLPIGEYVQMEGRKVLTINHCAQILIRVANGDDWAKALVDTIPARKNPQAVAPPAQPEEAPGGGWCNVA